jgi:hypothetical protein
MIPIDLSSRDIAIILSSLKARLSWHQRMVKMVGIQSTQERMHKRIEETEHLIATLKDQQ